MRILDNDIYRNDLIRASQNIDLSALKNKSVCITGGLGLIGSAVIDLLLVSNVTSCIYVLARNKEKFEEKYKQTDKVKFISWDALKPMNITIECDYVIYGAGLASPELYVKEPVETMLSNFFGIHEMLRYSKKNNVKRLLYISSSEVYGKKETEESFAEDNYGLVNIDDIRSTYAVAKRASELLCKSYFSEYGVETVIVRPGHIYGPSASPEDKRISSDFAFKAARGENLEMKSSGLQKRSYCYSIDCAVGILTVLIFGKSGEAYNIGHSEVMRIREMATILAEAGNTELLEIEPTAEEIKMFNPMRDSFLDDRKIRSLGYNNIFTPEEGLSHTVKILKEVLSSNDKS